MHYRCGKRRKSSIRKVVIIFLGHLWVVHFNVSAVWHYSHYLPPVSCHWHRWQICRWFRWSLIPASICYRYQQHQRYLKQKISWTCPFNHIICSCPPLRLRCRNLLADDDNNLILSNLFFSQKILYQYAITYYPLKIFALGLYCVDKQSIKRSEERHFPNNILKIQWRICARALKETCSI